MNARERFIGALTGTPIDRVPFMPVFGGPGKVTPAWEQQHPGLSSRIAQELKFEGAGRGWLGLGVNTFLCGEPEATVLEEDEERVIVQTGCGGVKRIQKKGDFHESNLVYPVRSRRDWLNLRSRFLDPEDERRFPADWTEKCRLFQRRDYPLKLAIQGVYNSARMLMGDERLAYAFYDEPDLVHSMMECLTDLTLRIWEKTCRDVEQFDLIESWEAFAYRSGCFVSPATFREFIKPQYEKIAAFAKAHGIKILLCDSHGFVENLVELVLESGFTAMFPFEVQAGNDLDRVMDRYPDLGIIGGLDKGCMSKGKREIDQEIEKARKLMARRGRYIPGPDYFPLSDVTYENYQYFSEQLRQTVLKSDVRLH